MRSAILVVVMAALLSTAYGVFESGLQNEFSKLKAEPKASTAKDARALLDKASAFVEKVEKYENPPKGLMSEARQLKLQRTAEWAKLAGTDLAAKAVESARKLLEKWGDTIPTEEEKTKAGEARPADSPLTPEEADAFKKNTDPTSDTIPASGKPRR